MLALPGFTDLYARLREPGLSRMGTIDSESHAALAAGFTRVLAAPDTSPVVDSVATVEQILRLSAASTGAEVLPMAALTRNLDGEQLAELATLKAAGAVAASQADRPIANTQVLYNAFEYAASFDLPLIMTPRDALLGAAGCVHAGARATRMGLPGIPVAAETIALASYLEIAREVGARLHLSRLSSAEALTLVDDARQRGIGVTADVGVSHLFHTDDDIVGFDNRFHSAVPLRSAHDRDALRAGVAKGLVDAICSDHAPLDADARLAPFASSLPGISTYDFMLPMLLELVRDETLSWSRLVDALALAPERILFSDERRGRNQPTASDQPGSLTVGNIANIVLLDTSTEYLPAAATMLSKGHNSPLPGDEAQVLTGRTVAVCRGNHYMALSH
ncbi:MAG: dihydroorotase [Gammaproteobacteria bacterium]|nr:MAG: dihydroorotase [Gammaproteobacteria bacterium]